MTTNTYQTQATDTTSRVLNWALGALAGLIVLVVVGLGIAIAGTSVYYELNRTKAGDVEGMMTSELPAGTPAAAVMAYLDSKGIAHSQPEPAGAADLELLEAGIPRGTTVVRAVVPNRGYGIDVGNIEMSLLLDLVDVQVRLTFDEAGNLKDRLFYDAHHRPTMLDFSANAPADGAPATP